MNQPESARAFSAPVRARTRDLPTARAVRSAVDAMSQLARVAQETLDRDHALADAGFSSAASDGRTLRAPTAAGASNPLSGMDSATGLQAVRRLFLRELSATRRPPIAAPMASTTLRIGTGASVLLTACAVEALQALVPVAVGPVLPTVPVNIQPLPRAWADPVLMHLLFVNLIGNAMRCTRGVRGGRVDVFTTQARGREAVCVRDNGVGCPLDGVAAGRSSAGLAELDMSLVRAIVERHGGEFWTRSQAGHGCEVFFALPRLVDPADW